MDKVNAEYNGKDQHWQDETTVYWFTLSGTDYGTGHEFQNDQYGVADCNGNETIVDCDGASLTDGDGETVAVRNSVSVTDEMRFE